MNQEEILELMKSRHSVRSYLDKKIEGETLTQLQNTIDQCNKDGDLNIQLCLNEPKAFSGMMAKYGKFSNVKNYIVLAGKKNSSLDEKCGYYGEKIVLKSAELGLNTCWVAMTYSKSKTSATINSDEKILIVIAIGYGENKGVAHPVKSVSQLSKVTGEMPVWFERGMKAAQLAPTAMNQQKFSFELDGNKVTASSGKGFYTKVDLGIVKYHFEVAADSNEWSWA